VKRSRKLSKLERAIELAEKAIDLGRTEIIREAEVSADDFNAIAEPFEARSDAPWLKRFVENGQEVTRVLEVEGKNGYWRTPSPEQLEIGIVAETHDQYIIQPRRPDMTIQLDKNDLAMIHASGHGLDTAGMQALEAGVIARLTKLIESGVVDAISRNHVRSAITAELNRGK